MLYVGYLVSLLVLPSLVWWRRGLLAALAVTALEVLLVGVSFYAMSVYHLLPELSPSQQQPVGENPMGYIRERQAEGYAQLALFAIMPASAALAGGGLAIVWSAMCALWRAAHAAAE